MKFNFCIILRIVLSILGFVIYFKFLVPWIIKKINFETLNKRNPYWLIKAFLYSALIYPVIIEVVGYIGGVKQFTLYEFLLDNKEYYGTVIALMLASISFIREDMNRKEEANIDKEKIIKLEQKIEELKQNSIKKKD